MNTRPPIAPAVAKSTITAAMRANPAIRTALARLAPADRAHVGKAIADAIAARLRQEGHGE
jgi:hypothetical protein